MEYKKLGMSGVRLGSKIGSSGIGSKQGLWLRGLWIRD